MLSAIYSDPRIQVLLNDDEEKFAIDYLVIIFKNFLTSEIEEYKDENAEEIALRTDDLLEDELFYKAKTNIKIFNNDSISDELKNLDNHPY